MHKTKMRTRKIHSPSSFTSSGMFWILLCTFLISRKEEPFFNSGSSLWKWEPYVEKRNHSILLKSGTIYWKEVPSVEKRNHFYKIGPIKEAEIILKRLCTEFRFWKWFPFSTYWSGNGLEIFFCFDFMVLFFAWVIFFVLFFLWEAEIMVPFFYSKIGSCVSADFSGSRFLQNCVAIFNLLFLSAIFPLIFFWRFWKKKKWRIKWYRKMVPVFYTLIRYRNFLKIEMVLFFSIFNRSDSPQKALSNTLETVSAEVQFGFFFGSFLCKSMEW